MFFTNIAAMFAIFALALGALAIAGSFIFFSGFEQRLMTISAGVSLILSGCLIGTLVEISYSVNKLNKS